MRRAREFLDCLWLPVFAFLAWEIFAMAGDAPIYLPRFSSVLAALVELCSTEEFWREVLSTCMRCSLGFLAALMLGVPLGILLGISPLFYRKLRVLIEFFRPLPSASIIPICILFLGIGDGMKIFVIAFGSVWPILINSIDGVLNIHRDYFRVAGAYDIDGCKRILRVILPLSSPAIFTGMKIAISIALILTITAEMIVGGGGLGYFIIDAERAFRFEHMYAAVLFVGFLGVFINAAVVQIERAVISWR